MFYFNVVITQYNNNQNVIDTFLKQVVAQLFGQNVAKVISRTLFIYFFVC